MGTVKPVGESGIMAHLKSMITRRTSITHSGSNYDSNTIERPPSPKRKQSKSRIKSVKKSEILEEEKFPWYNPDNWCPVRVGYVFKERYQVIGKLGFGSVSTAWLCRDLAGHRYITLKIYVSGHRQAENEHKVLQHLESVSKVSNHPGRNFLRTSLGTFELLGFISPHKCLIYYPLGTTLKDLQRQFPNNRIPASILKPIIRSLLCALDFLHAEANVIHTDLYANNILLTLPNPNQTFTTFEAQERNSPSARKIDGRKVIITSRALPSCPSPLPSAMHAPPSSSLSSLLSDDQIVRPILCDFGDARCDQETSCKGEAMPDLYRAPEIILQMEWGSGIDIWALGLMIWEMLQGKRIFATALPDRLSSRGALLTRLIAILGPPDLDFLHRSESWEDFWNRDGSWKGNPITPTSLEDEEECLNGEEKVLFMRFMRRMLQWRAEDRASARELMEDPWLDG